MEISSADFTKLTLQKVADMLIDHDANGVICKGIEELKKSHNRMTTVLNELEVLEDYERWNK